MATPTAWGTEFLVNSITDNYQDHPAISALANGKFVAIWEDNLVRSEIACQPVVPESKTIQTSREHESLAVTRQSELLFAFRTYLSRSTRLRMRPG